MTELRRAQGPDGRWHWTAAVAARIAASPWSRPVKALCGAKCTVPNAAYTVRMRCRECEKLSAAAARVNPSTRKAP